jgi:hypothetical protein
VHDGKRAEYHANQRNTGSSGSDKISTHLDVIALVLVTLVANCRWSASCRKRLIAVAVMRTSLAGHVYGDGRRMAGCVAMLRIGGHDTS